MRKITVAVLLTLVATLGALTIVKSSGHHSPYQSAFQVTATDAQAAIGGGYQCSTIHCVRPAGGIPYCGAGQGLNCRVFTTAGGLILCTESICSTRPPVEIVPDDPIQVQ
jgi:hypothetical protein